MSEILCHNFVLNIISSKYRASWFVILHDASLMHNPTLTGKFKEWLNAPDPSINHNNIRKKHHKGTGQWLLDDERYVAWKEQSNSFLWINGICR